MQALLWPVNDVPKIFEIGTRGASAALPGLVEVGLVAYFVIMRPIKTGNDQATTAIDLALGYAAASAASLVLNKI